MSCVKALTLSKNKQHLPGIETEVRSDTPLWWSILQRNPKSTEIIPGQNPKVEPPMVFLWEAAHHQTLSLMWPTITLVVETRFGLPSMPLGFCRVETPTLLPPLHKLLALVGVVPQFVFLFCRTGTLNLFHCSTQFSICQWLTCSCSMPDANGFACVTLPVIILVAHYLLQPLVCGHPQTDAIRGWSLFLWREAVRPYNIHTEGIRYFLFLWFQMRVCRWWCVDASQSAEWPVVKLLQKEPQLDICLRMWWGGLLPPSWPIDSCAGEFYMLCPLLL